MWDLIYEIFVWILLGTIVVLGTMLLMMGISWLVERRKKMLAMDAQREYFEERARILGTAPARVNDNGGDVQVIGGVEFRRMRPRRQLGENFGTRE